MNNELKQASLRVICTVHEKVFDDCGCPKGQDSWLEYRRLWREAVKEQEEQRKARIEAEDKLPTLSDSDAKAFKDAYELGQERAAHEETKKALSDLKKLAAGQMNRMTELYKQLEDADDKFERVMRGAKLRRGANWPGVSGIRCFLGFDDGETCILCTKHISKHFGGTEYRCEPLTLCPHCGREDDCDCQERINCTRAGEILHQCCGICPEHRRPRFQCEPACWKRKGSTDTRDLVARAVVEMKCGNCLGEGKHWNNTRTEEVSCAVCNGCGFLRVLP